MQTVTMQTLQVLFILTAVKNKGDATSCQYVIGRWVISGEVEKKIKIAGVI